VVLVVVELAAVAVLVDFVQELLCQLLLALNIPLPLAAAVLAVLLMEQLG
jgi:hypothetical protein